MSSPLDFRAVVDALQAQPLRVAETYAPGGYVDGARYWALNPGRADRHIGSFHVGVTGTYAGHWRDEATGEHGDMLDLIQLSTGDRRRAFEEARGWLGLAAETPAQRALRERQASRAAETRAADAARAEADTARKRASAHALFLQCRPELADTPVGAYLAARGIGLDRLARAPGALRYHPSLAYRHIDPETGEILEAAYPAMVAAIHGPAREAGPPEFWGAHRTWLAPHPVHGWWKAPVPAPKKILGTKRGGFIRLWSGMGPRGGKGAPLSQVAEARVYVTEGIEDGLSVAVLMPHARVLAAIDLANMRELVLPPAVRHVTILRDNDTDPKLGRLADLARERLLLEGRDVSTWVNTYGGKDLNDALMLALREDRQLSVSA